MSKFRDSRLYEALDYLDEAYVAEVVENLKVPPAPGLPTRKRGQLRYIVALAACLLVLSMAIPVITYVLQNYADIVGFFTNETTADTSPELTEPETPAPETTQNSPETSADTDHETTEAPYDGTTAAPEPEYDGSRGLVYKMWEDGKSFYLAGMGTCTDENIIVASTYDGYPVTVIGEDALAGYDRVKSITIPDSVTAIDMRAFKDCTGLESITIPDTVYYISGNAFMNCTSLKSIKLPASLELVNPSVFGGCTALEEIVVPDFVTEIYIMAFYQCTNLKSVTLGRRVEKIWADVFRDCENLTEINFAGTMARWNAIEKDDEWNFGSVIEVVHCTDGDVAIEPYSDSEPEYDGSQGLEYRVNDDGKGATLIGLGSCKDADIVVASFYKGYPVTDIEFAAFAGSTRITSITLSDSVLRVDYNTFSNCNENLKHIYISKSVQEFGENAFSFLKSLESITVSPENPRYYVEGNCLIDRETKCILRGWGEFTIPSDGSVTSIAKGAFSCCNIVNVTVPKGITEIGGAAFAFCASLKSISLPEGLTAIGSSMFDSCTSLESITLPDSVTMIDVAAFAYCENLLSIRIGRNVEVIEKQAFYYSAVREIEFAGTVSEWKGIRKPDSWNENCFVTVIHCSDDAIEIIEYDGSRGLLYKVMPDGKSAMLIGVGTNPDKSLIIATEYNGVPVTTIAAEAFRNNTNVKSIYILGSVQYIESEAFAFCTSLEKIVLPDSLISIGDGAFNGCTSLESINIPKGITEIGSFTFSECSSLKEITIPEGVTVIGNEAFYMCKGLKKVTLPSTLDIIGSWAFANCESLESIVIPDGIMIIEIRAFSDCVKLSSLNLGKELEQIQEKAFMNCTSLKSVTIPGKVIYFGNAAFMGCSALESVTLTKGVNMIGSGVFSDCVKLKSINYTGSMVDWNEIEKYPDWNKNVLIDQIVCSNGNISLKEDTVYTDSRGLAYKINKDKTSATLVGMGTCTDTNIVIASTFCGVPVTAIDGTAFQNNQSITGVYIPASLTFSPDTFLNCQNLTSLTLDPSNTLYYSEGNCIIHKESKTIFMGCNGSVIPDDGSVLRIGQNAFVGCNAFTELIIPEGIIIIYDGAFNNCVNLKSVKLPESLTKLNSAFQGCTSLEHIELPDNMERLGGFIDCTSLKNIDLPKKAKLSTAAFRGCTSLESVAVPEGTTSLNYMFEDCTSLKSVTLPDSLTSINYSAFLNCVSLKSITIPSAVVEIKGGAFKNCTSLSDFNYSGTVAQWNAIEKEVGWNNDCPFTVIHCADGEITLSPLTEEEAIEAARKHWGLDSSSIIIVKDDPSADSPQYKIAHCEYAQSVGEFEIKREVYVDQRTGECKEVVYDYPNIPEVFLDVIFNREKFLYVEQTRSADGEYKYTTSEALFKDHSVHHENVFGAQDLWYHLIDIDGDSIPELIFPGSARSNYGMLFRVYNGKVYGYACILNDLNTDATYIWHEQAGNYVGRSQVYFDGIFYKSRSLTEYDKNDPNNIIYYVEGKETTKEKYEEFESAFSDEELEAFELDYYPIYVNPYPGG